MVLCLYTCQKMNLMLVMNFDKLSHTELSSSILAFRSLHVNFKLVTPERPLDFQSQSLVFQFYPLSVMSQKSKQKSRSKSQLEDYAFTPSPQPHIFEYPAQFRKDEPDFRPVFGHPSPSERKQDSLDKLALELEVLCLSQALGPATPPTTSAVPCLTGKSDAGSKKRTIDWPQDFVTLSSIFSIYFL